MDRIELNFEHTLALIIYSTKKENCVCGAVAKDLHHFWIFLISESYAVSNLLQKGAVFEFLAPIVAEKISF